MNEAISQADAWGVFAQAAGAFFTLAMGAWGASIMWGAIKSFVRAAAE